MYSETIDLASEVSLKKSNFLKDNFLGYFISSMLAGVYVGFGIILIFAVGAPFAYAELPPGECIGLRPCRYMEWF